jgi:hypothetical protein
MEIDFAKTVRTDRRTDGQTDKQTDRRTDNCVLLYVTTIYVVSLCTIIIYLV